MLTLDSDARQRDDSRVCVAAIAVEGRAVVKVAPFAGVFALVRVPAGTAAVVAATMAVGVLAIVAVALPTFSVTGTTVVPMSSRPLHAERVQAQTPH